MSSPSKIFEKAKVIGSWPNVSSPTIASHFVKALSNLKDYCEQHDCDAGDGTPAKRGERSFYLPQTQAVKATITAIEPIKNASNATLNRVCANFGLTRKCLSARDVTTVYADNKKLQGHFVTVMDAYRIDLTVDFSEPSSEVTRIADDVLSAIADGYTEEKLGSLLEAKTLSTYSISDKPQGIGRTGAAGEGGDPAETAEETRHEIDWEAPDTQDTPAAVVEPSLPKVDPNGSSVADLSHPYFDEDTNTAAANLAPLPILPSIRINSKDDRGHAYHVAGIISGKRKTYGWVGMSPNSTLRLFKLDEYDTWTEQNKAPAGRNYFRAINFSLSLGQPGCALNPNNSNLFIRLQTGVLQNSRSTVTDAVRANPSRPAGTPLYVFAAAEPSQDACPNPAAPPPPASECSDLPCLGRYPAAITVLPLDSNGVPRSDAIQDPDNLMLAAPGTNILSADVDPVTQEKGFRLRSGSSQAAPMVTAAAIELASHYPNSLDRAADLKVRLYSTARLFPEPAESPLPDCARGAVGILDMRRALESDPDQDTVWFRDRNRTPLQGQVLYFSARDKRKSEYSNIPLNDGPKSCQGGPVPISKLLAIKRIYGAPGQQVPIMFRNVYADDGSSLSSRIRVGAPYQIDNTGTGQFQNFRCATSIAQMASMTKACLQIIEKGKRVPTFLEVTDIDQIIFAKGDQFD